MNRSTIQAAIRTALYFSILALLASPLVMAQQAMQVVRLSNASQTALVVQPAASSPQVDAPQSSAISERNQALKFARTIHINSETMFLTAGTLDRALMKQKDWDKLGLNILNNPGRADLELQVNRVVFTHVHTYVLTDKSTGIVLASGKVTAFDGVIASGPMAEQIVKILSAARLGTRTASGSSGL
jgi:hypothetical protein